MATRERSSGIVAPRAGCRGRCVRPKRAPTSSTGATLARWTAPDPARISTGLHRRLRRSASWRRTRSARGAAGAEIAPSWSMAVRRPWCGDGVRSREAASRTAQPPLSSRTRSPALFGQARALEGERGLGDEGVVACAGVSGRATTSGLKGRRRAPRGDRQRRYLRGRRPNVAVEACALAVASTLAQLAVVVATEAQGRCIHSPAAVAEDRRPREDDLELPRGAATRSGTASVWQLRDIARGRPAARALGRRPPAGGRGR